MHSPSSPDVPAQLLEFRSEIDIIDEKIIALLGRRFRVTAQVGELKAKYNLNSIDSKREEDKLDLIAEQAQLQGLNIDFITNLFQSVFSEVVRNHNLWRDKMEQL
jgi:chorismate mutase